MIVDLVRVDKVHRITDSSTYCTLSGMDPVERGHRAVHTSAYGRHGGELSLIYFEFDLWSRQAGLGVTRSKEAKLVVVCSPVGSYLTSGWATVADQLIPNHWWLQCTQTIRQSGPLESRPGQRRSVQNGMVRFRFSVFVVVSFSKYKHALELDCEMFPKLKQSQQLRSYYRSYGWSSGARLRSIALVVGREAVDYGGIR